MALVEKRVFPVEGSVEVSKDQIFQAPRPHFRLTEFPCSAKLVTFTIDFPCWYYLLEYKGCSTWVVFPAQRGRRSQKDNQAYRRYSPTDGHMIGDNSKLTALFNGRAGIDEVDPQRSLHYILTTLGGSRG
jgi:hypothetical protein